MHPEVHGKTKACSVCGMELTEPVTQAVVVPEEVMSQVEPLSKSSFSVDEVLNNYLKLKNALTKTIPKKRLMQQIIPPLQ
jgi:hypothetical protein